MTESEKLIKRIHIMKALIEIADDLVCDHEDEYERLSGWHKLKHELKELEGVQ